SELVKMYGLTVSDSTKWAAAVATGLIENLPTPVLSLASGEGNTKTEGGLSWRKIQATVTFTWGHSNTNPYTYYNGQTYTKALGDEVKTKLTTLYAINSLTYSTTIKTGNLID
ncbi:MAG: hypothetical protein K6C32_03555, partial [Bacilli bacterium]|nr:hypothetical protein [Bacilli bacterium]